MYGFDVAEEGVSLMSAISRAAEWILALASGTVMTLLMTIAVAFFAISMLSGHLSIRRGFQLVLGCFIVAGSSEISQSMIARAPHGDVATAFPDPVSVDPGNLPPLGPEPPPQESNGNPFDPYAGQKPIQ